MSIAHTTRRGFLKGACFLSAGLMLSVRMAGRAFAEVKGIKAYMTDRINAVYGADSAFAPRASQDNSQVRAMYADWLGKPLGELSEEHLHTQWFDKSAEIKSLQRMGAYPNPRRKEFSRKTYRYEE